MDERIRFCQAGDGTRIAYGVSGGGPGRPLVRVATWLTHLQYDRALVEHWTDELGADRPFVRYDLRGCGLSDREVSDFSLDAKVSDLEAVVDAADLGRFDLLGLSGGGPVAVAYAVRHPHRVAHLVLYGSYLSGRAKRRGLTALQREEQALLVSLTRVGWGSDNPAFRRVFSTLFMPDAPPDVVAAYEEVQRRSCSGETAARIREASYGTDVSELAARVRSPTLVMHLRDDGAAPFEEGRRLAAAIPGAQFVQLEGRNHILGKEDPHWPLFVEELQTFVAEDRDVVATDGLESLTAREVDVLRLISDGLDNDGIAGQLTLSVRTVERHLSNIYGKLGLSGRAARAAAAARFARRS